MINVKNQDAEMIALNHASRALLANDIDDVILDLACGLVWACEARSGGDPSMTNPYPAALATLETLKELSKGP